MASAIRVIAALTRSATAVADSPFGGLQVMRSAGYRSRISASLSPSQSPPNRSRSPLSDVTGRPVSLASGAAVCCARDRSEAKIAAGRSVTRRLAAYSAWASPVSSSGMSL